ncbi:molybdenum cofactor guanylyltransferase [Qipengyuania mesophila]|uniref:molybdenum cofactor guanylyltransferase n=1 Tax=Qipengyuania mesophila TaxID=2867246 RepID=UPI00351663A4
MNHTPPSLKYSSHCIVIACGGQGTRMGGDKPWRALGGKALVERVADWALAQSDCVALALRDRHQAPALELPVVLDRHSGIGPITALASAFDFAETNACDYVLMVGCDQPFLPRDLLSHLESEIGNAAAAVPVSNGREQPMATLWRTDSVSLAKYIDDGGQSLRRFAKDVGAKFVDWGADEDPFFNANDQHALALAERRLKSAAR